MSQWMFHTQNLSVFFQFYHIVPDSLYVLISDKLASTVQSFSLTRSCRTNWTNWWTNASSWCEWTTSSNSCDWHAACWTNWPHCLEVMIFSRSNQRFVQWTVKCMCSICPLTECHVQKTCNLHRIWQQAITLCCFLHDVQHPFGS